MHPIRRIGRILMDYLLLPIFALVVLLPVLKICTDFEFHAPLMRGVVMAFGKTGKGFVTKKYLPDGTFTRYTISVNFQCRDGVALHEYLSVARESFEKAVLDQEIAIRYLPRLCSWVVLEDDAGYARGKIGLFLDCLLFALFLPILIPALRRLFKRGALLLQRR